MMDGSPAGRRIPNPLNGVFTIRAGQTYTINGTFIVNGTLNIQPGGTLIVNGSVIENGTINNDGTLTINP
jgi:septum formation inhibitor MinC